MDSLSPNAAKLIPSWGVQPEAFSGTETTMDCLQVEAGRGRSWSDLNFCWHAPNPVLVKAKLGAQLGPSCKYQGPEETATNCGSLVAPNRWFRVSHRRCLTLGCNRVPPKRPNTNTLVARFRQQSKSSKLHKQHIQREIFAATKQCWDKFGFM